jgi:hypothetical protein
VLPRLYYVDNHDNGIGTPRTFVAFDSLSQELTRVTLVVLYVFRAGIETDSLDVTASS